MGDPVREDGPQQRPALEHFGSLEDLCKEGLVPFLLGPVYAYSGVEESLIFRFVEDENRKNVRGGTVRFDEPILTYCQDHNYLMDVMDAESYLHFKKWLLSQNFIDYKKRKYFEVRSWMARVTDPVLLQSQRKVKYISIELFTVSGVRGLLRPVCPVAVGGDERYASSHILLESAPPEERVIVAARAALQVCKDGL